MPRRGNELVELASNEVVAGVLQRHIAETRPQSGTDTVQVFEVLPPASGTVAPDPVIDVIDTVINALENGADMQAVYPKIHQLVTNAPERQQLLTSLLEANDLTRLPKILRARKNLENLLLAAASRNDLQAHEALAFMTLIAPEAERVSARVRAGASDIQDIEGLLNKVDIKLQDANERQRQALIDGTTPQAREMMRRVLYKLHKRDAPPGTLPDDAA